MREIMHILIVFLGINIIDVNLTVGIKLELYMLLNLHIYNYRYVCIDKLYVYLRLFYFLLVGIYSQG